MAAWPAEVYSLLLQSLPQNRNSKQGRYDYGQEKKRNGSPSATKLESNTGKFKLGATKYYSKKNKRAPCGGIAGVG